MKPEYKLIFNYLKPYKKRIIICGALMLLNVILLTPTPLITMYIIDNILPAKDLKLLSILASLLIFILLFNSFISYILNVFFIKLNSSFIFDIKLDLLKAFQFFPLGYLKKMQTGYIMSRIDNDPQNLSGFFATTLLSIIKDSIILIIGITILFWLHWKLAIITLIVLPAFIYSIKYFSKRIRVLSIDFFEQEALLTKQTQESISLLELFKSFCAEEFDRNRFSGVLRTTIDKYITKSKMEYLSNVVAYFIGSIGPILVIWYGMSEVINDNLKLGELIAFNSFIAYVFGPTSRLTNINAQIQNSIAALSRINEIINNKNYKILITKPFTKYNIQGEINFSNVTYSYDNKQVFSNVNLQIKSNSIIGIIGESGSGKSTLAKLLLGYDEVNSGHIYIDNILINKIHYHNLRNNIAIVEQEPLLYNDTIYNNIKLGNPSATLQQIKKAAKMAYIDDFIQNLDDGYNTIINERSFNISVGEKQRIAIARAIVRDPKILILDEFTSNLDIASESILLKQLLPFLKTRTTLIIAHRLSTVNIADEIFLLKDGRLLKDEK